MTDPTRSLRGGSWFCKPLSCRAALRFSIHPANVITDAGFRVVCLPREVPPPRMLLRGGCWYLNPRFCRSALRNHIQPDYANDLIGLRVVCLPQEETP